jgi:hypothetical protein
MTITLTREEAQSVLDALQAALSDDQPYIDRCKQTVEALRARLAQPEPEPVGYWQGEFSKDGGATIYEVPQESAFGRKYRNIPLYTAPPQRNWQGLTDDEITALKRKGERYISSQDFARAIEAKLKEKNT